MSGRPTPPRRFDTPPRTSPSPQLPASALFPSSPRNRLSRQSSLVEEVDGRTIVRGFSPPSMASPLPAVAESSQAPLTIVTSSSTYTLGSLTFNPFGPDFASRLSPATTPIEQTYTFPYDGPPRPSMSPRFTEDMLPRSRRNSAAIASVSLSSRSTSRTPRRTPANLPPSTPEVRTPSDTLGSKTVTPRNGDASQANSANGHRREARNVFAGTHDAVNGDDFWPSGADGINDDEWQPTGGVLLDDEAVEDEDAEPRLNNIMVRGQLFGEGLEFQGEPVTPAIGLIRNGHIELPLRRGDSEAGHARIETQTGGEMRKRKVYEVVKSSGSGSYGVVYCLREKGGRRREYGKCLYVI